MPSPFSGVGRAVSGKAASEEAVLLRCSFLACCRRWPCDGKCKAEMRQKSVRVELSAHFSDQVTADLLMWGFHSEFLISRAVFFSHPGL